MHLSKTDFDKLTMQLVNAGYKRILGHYKREDFGYWQTFEKTHTQPGYQIAVLVYDFNRFEQTIHSQPYRIAYEMVLNAPYARDIKLSIYDDALTFMLFERACNLFYKNICQGFLQQFNTKI